jgi:hypothetical protein
MKYMSVRLFACLAVASITSACNQTSTTKLDAGVTVFEEATLTATQSATTFPNTAIGTDSPQQKITFSNIGLESTGPVSLVFEGANASEFVMISSNCSQPLVYMASCEVSLLFRPLSQGPKSARITASATPGKTFSVILSATSQSPAAATINPSIGTFPTVPLLPATSTMPSPPMIAFAVTNTGGSPTTLDSTIDGTDNGEFQKADGCSGLTLMPNATCTITVYFLPTSPGLKSATLTVTGDHVKLSVPLNGNATSLAMLTMTPTMQEFGSVQFGMTNVQPFTVKNDGGQASGKLSANIIGASSAGFSISNNTCVDVLNPGETCNILVTFAPMAGNGPGPKMSLLSVTAPMGGNLTASLSGTATAAVVQGMLALLPIAGSNSFGTVTIGNMATAVYSVQNNGNAPTGKIMATVSGPGNEFAVTNNGCPDTLAIGETCLLTITFTPQNVGAKSASLQVFANPGGFAAVSLSATALVGPVLTITPTFFSFGTHTINTNQTATPTVFTVRNSGNDVSGPVSVMLEGTDMGNFQIVATDCQNLVLQPRNQNSCSVRVRFVPIAVGTFAPYLTAVANPGNTVRATLSGVGRM